MPNANLGGVCVEASRSVFVTDASATGPDGADDSFSLFCFFVQWGGGTHPYLAHSVPLRLSWEGQHLHRSRLCRMLT